MFRRSSEPLALSEASLLALRPALNAPVLNTDFLPVGPARAAIVVFAEEYGGIGLAIGVRSNEGGQIAVFRNQEPIDADQKFSDILEPALLSAEQMGFLFDEELIESVPGGRGRAQAMAHWRQLMGEIDIPARPMPPESIISELLLDDVVPLEMTEISLDLEEERQPTVSPDSPASVGHPLTKFRNARPGPATKPVAPQHGADQASAMPEERSELGRIPLVRVRREGKKRVTFLARLLSSF